MNLVGLNHFLSPQITFMGTKHSLGPLKIIFLSPPPMFSRKVPFMYLSSETEHKALKVAEIFHLCTITHFYGR